MDKHFFTLPTLFILDLTSPGSPIEFLQNINFLVNLKSKTLVITSCSKVKNNQKTEETVPAEDLYTGRLFQKVRQYAELKGFDYMILSAKYGLIHPDEKISVYDNVLRSKKDVEKIKNQANTEFQKISNNYKTILVIAGKNYRLALADSWDERFVYLKTTGYACMQKMVSDAVKLIIASKL